MICKKCGNPLGECDNLCSKCGTIVEKENVKTRSNKPLYIFLVFILSVAIGVSSFYVMKFIDSKNHGDIVDSSPMEANIEDIFQNGYLQYLGKNQQTVLSNFTDYREYGEFEGAYLYLVGQSSFGFDLSADRCTSVYCSFKEAFPYFENTSDIVTEQDFEKYIGMDAELVKHLAKEDIQVPHLSIYNDDFYILAGCDENGNIQNDSWCQVVVKNFIN